MTSLDIGVTVMLVLATASAIFAHFVTKNKNDKIQHNH